ncbi:MAG: methyltransferase domain-containing protein [Candidatus Rokubacteria bacterium]|nr:methyltransferase domain-containing protein [Candidatus Rokubacteria bacterium]
MRASHPDPYRAIDAQADPDKLIQSLEQRGRTRSHAQLRRRFLRFVGIRPAERVLEVGCGSGVVLRDVAALVGPEGRVVGVDPSRRAVDIARSLCAGPEHRRVTVRLGDGMALPFSARRFDVALAVTVVLHVADPQALVTEMARVTRPGGRIGLQDQDFGTVAVTHPDRELTDRIMRGVASRIYEEPHSGRRLPGLLRAAGLDDVRLRTGVYQDTDLEPYTKTFLERRAENAVRFGIADATTVQRWLDGFTRLVADRSFVMTMNFYGAVGTKPGRKTAQ